MKFFCVLGVVGGLSALAIDHTKGPSHPDTDITPELNIEQAGSDLAERSENHGSGLEKRVWDEIPIPHGVENPQSIVKLGLVISFTMAGQWVRQGARNVWTYTCKAVKFSNGGNLQKTITVTSGLVNYMENQALPAHKAMAVKAMPGGFQDTIDVNIN